MESIKPVLEELQGVIKVEVDLASGIGRVLYGPMQISIADIEDAVRRASYHPKVLTKEPVESENKKVE